MDFDISEQQRILNAITATRKRLNCDLKENTAAHIIARIRKHRSIGVSFKDARNTVLNRTEYPNDKVRRGYNSVIGTIMGRNGALVRANKRAAEEADRAVTQRTAS